jgi:hypothetical protein
MSANDSTCRDSTCSDRMYSSLTPSDVSRRSMQSPLIENSSRSVRDRDVGWCSDVLQREASDERAGHSVPTSGVLTSGVLTSGVLPSGAVIFAAPTFPAPTFAALTFSLCSAAPVRVLDLDNDRRFNRQVQLDPRSEGVVRSVALLSRERPVSR